MKTISIRLTDQAESKLNWLEKELNRGAITKTTMTDIILTAIHNEWIEYNVSLIDCEDDKYCDPDYFKTVGKTADQIRELWGKS